MTETTNVPTEQIVGNITTKQLTGWGTFDQCTSIRPLLFGFLANLYWPLADHYKSDLYHDAQWISTNVSGPITFYFGADQWGTAIGTDPINAFHTSREYGWKITLRCDERGQTWEGRPENYGMWIADAECVKAPVA